ncbi:MAG: hypothetical protein RBR20_14850, partial [Desulfobacterales bacterium]|nr:hypothetical protein [Desulfobacterales bacterium]
MPEVPAYCGWSGISYFFIGDLGRTDEDGYFWYVARRDDVITSSGYRIGPAEIEDCLIKHP